ncbi:MAG: endopeptidase, partial [bacterium]|nr:endopeptidase [bacterium]
MGIKTTSSGRALGLCVAVAFCLTLTTGLSWALVPKDSGDLKAGDALSAKEFFQAELYISSSQRPVDEAMAELPNRRAWARFQALRESAGKGRLHAFIDPRSGAATNMIDVESLIPGNGVGNQVTLAELSSRFGYEVRQVGPSEVADAVLDFVGRHRELLGIDMGQLGNVRAVRVNDELWNVSIPQTYHDIQVRDGRMAATLNNGNLVLIGTETWGNVSGLSHVPSISAKQAMEIGFEYTGASPMDEIVLRPSLEIVPLAPPEHQQGPAFSGPIGDGYSHRLVWTFQFRRPPEGATWEVMVDAHSGEVISFKDVNDYATVSGGVYPVTSTEICPTPGTCGIMQSDWPMPWADTGLASPNNYTNSGGVFTGSGSTNTTLSGLYVDISDNCGSISISGSPSIDLAGVNGDHDCTTGGGSAGNTPASRTAFYEVN